MAQIKELDLKDELEDLNLEMAQMGDLSHELWRVSKRHEAILQQKARSCRLKDGNVMHCIS